MKEPGGIERNRPELCRSLRMTDAICPPTASPWKSTIAIGTGSKLGFVMSIVSWARAADDVTAVSATPRIVRRGSIMSNLLVILRGASIARPGSVVAWIEVKGDGTPGVVFVRRQRPGLAAWIADGAHRR